LLKKTIKIQGFAKFIRIYLWIISLSPQDKRPTFTTSL